MPEYHGRGSVLELFDIYAVSSCLRKRVKHIRRHYFADFKQREFILFGEDFFKVKSLVSGLKPR